jgi:hypothetical protein
MNSPRTVTIWHNARCGKSRQTLELLRMKGIEPTIREYLKQPPSTSEVDKLIDLVGGDPGALIRDGEPEFKALKKKKAESGRPTSPRRRRPSDPAGGRSSWQDRAQRSGGRREAVLPLLVTIEWSDACASGRLRPSSMSPRICSITRSA